MGNKQSQDKSTNETKHTVLEPNIKIKEAAYRIENQLLLNSGLVVGEDVYTEDVNIDFYGNNYLHTIRCGKESDKISNNIVFLHGYMGSSMTFFKLFKYLYPAYNIYCPDIIGMALSSRPVVDFKSPQEWIDFFVNSLEKWRESLNLDKFHLVGHSLGGYLTSLYAMNYPQRITKLTLLSPAGITDPKIGGSVHEHMPFGKKLGFHMLGTVWGLKLTMQSFFENGLIRYIMKGSLRKRYEINKEENELFAKLTEYSFNYPTDLDKAIYYIFKNPIPTVNFPLEEKLLENIKDFQVDFIFGEEDWMDRAGSIRLCEKDTERFKFYTVSKSGHNFNLENPEELANLILQNDYNLTKEEKEECLKKIEQNLESKPTIEIEDIIVEKNDENDDKIQVKLTI